MPARRRRNKDVTPPAALDPVSQFGRMLREADERERAEKERVALRRQAAKDAARARTAQAETVAALRRDLERAIDAVKAARRDRRGVAEADAAWRRAKARLITLETGDGPSWSPGSTDDSAGDSTESDEADLDATDPASPAGSDAVG